MGTKIEAIKMELIEFVQDWTEKYSEKVSNHKLFDPDFITSLDRYDIVILFLRFYHGRGEFYVFLWYLLSLTDSKEEKNVVLENIKDESGWDKQSHEELYYEFLQSLGVSKEAVLKEVLEKNYNIQGVWNFNHRHQKYILNGSKVQRFAAFCAYEKLDNVDYPNWVKVVNQIRCCDKVDTRFFEIHCVVEHYDRAEECLRNRWLENPDHVKGAFEFIARNQLLLWDTLVENL